MRPDNGVKSSPNVSKSCPKCCNSSFYKRVRKVANHLGYFFLEIVSSRAFKNLSIWSHCSWGQHYRYWVEFDELLEALEGKLALVMSCLHYVKKLNAYMLLIRYQNSTIVDGKIVFKYSRKVLVTGCRFSLPQATVKKKIVAMMTSIMVMMVMMMATTTTN